VSDLITRRRNSVYGHIVRLPEDMPAHQALRCHVDLTLGHLPDQSWKHRPGRPNNRWIDQLRRDNNNMPPADLWRRSTTRGHTGVTRRSSTTMRWRQRQRLHLSVLETLVSVHYINLLFTLQLHYVNMSSAHQLQGYQYTGSHCGKHGRHRHFGNSQKLLRHHPNFTQATQLPTINPANHIIMSKWAFS